MNAMDDVDQGRRFYESLKTYANNKHSNDIKAISLSEDSMPHYTILVDAMSLFECNVEFACHLFKRPENGLKILKEAFCEAVEDAFEKYGIQNTLINKGSISVRLNALPFCPEIYRTLLPRCSDVGKFLCVTGTVVRVTVSKMLEYRKQWKCNKCGYKFTKDVEVEEDFKVVKPSVCENPDRCFSQKFSLVSKGIKSSWCKDYQEVKIQEQVCNLVVGTVPRSIWVVLTDDLVDSCQPGNDAVISGIVQTRWQPVVQDARCQIELVIVAHNVEVKNRDALFGIIPENSIKEFTEFWQKYHSNPLEGRDYILSCFCPQVFGLYIVKLAVALVLAGGVQRIDENGKIRGDIHLLLVGDPGTAKSQFLKYASKISDRSVLTSGIGTTNAGLTAAAMKDGGKWQLEAGALVLADGGICCIDEFSSIREQDKAGIHEAMEQQTVSVAKAGLVCKLDTQCSILAAMNPKGKYDKNESLLVNTALASPLLSRFDIILVLLDNHDEVWDNLVSSHIIGQDMVYENTESPSWSIEKLRTYFSFIRTKNPRITADCNEILQAYYKKQRSNMDRNRCRTTPRLLQSLLRLAQGHARLMFRNEVLALDAIVAVIVLESSMVGCGMLHDTDTLHSLFPDDPLKLYMEQASTILTFLDLKHLIKKEPSTSPIVRFGEHEDGVSPTYYSFVKSDQMQNVPGQQKVIEKHPKSRLVLEQNINAIDKYQEKSASFTKDQSYQSQSRIEAAGCSTKLPHDNVLNVESQDQETRSRCLAEPLTNLESHSIASKVQLNSLNKRLSKTCNALKVERNKTANVSDDDDFFDNLCSIGESEDGETLHNNLENDHDKQIRTKRKTSALFGQNMSITHKSPVQLCSYNRDDKLYKSPTMTELVGCSKQLDNTIDEAVGNLDEETVSKHFLETTVAVLESNKATNKVHFNSSNKKLSKTVSNAERLKRSKTADLSADNFFDNSCSVGISKDKNGSFVQNVHKKLIEHSHDDNHPFHRSFEKEHTFHDDVTTISELNDFFSDEALDAAFDVALDENFDDDSNVSSGLELFKKSAFKRKRGEESSL